MVSFFELLQFSFCIKILCLQDLGVLAQLKAEKDSVDALIQPVETADMLFKEIQNLQHQVGELEIKFDIQAQGSKSLEEIVSELKMLEKAM